MKVHLIGIAGTAMASLARLLKQLGHEVRGSDVDIYPPMSTQLEELAIPVALGYAEANLAPEPDLVVVGNAIPRGNPELEACLDRGLPYTSQAEAVEDLVLPGRVPVVITGTHGKTTTTSLTTWLLTVAERDPGWLIGGVPRDLATSADLGKGPEVVIEGDEYDTAYFDKRPKFHHYRPRILVINNLEFDHADIYDDLETIQREFRRLVNTVPRNGLLAVGADSPAALEVLGPARCPVVRFGTDADDLDLAATGITSDADGVRFTVTATDDGVIGDVSLPTHGLHNVRNALAGIAVARHLGVPFDRQAKALASFRGVRRRLELRGVFAGVSVFDDFAHHPTAIHETLQAIRARGLEGRLWAVIEPRSWSMRRDVHQDTLPGALAAADVVAILPVYQAEKVPGGRALDVARVASEVRDRGREVHTPSDSDHALELLRSHSGSGDVIVMMSNGGFDGLPERLATALGSEANG